MKTKKPSHEDVAALRALESELLSYLGVEDIVGAADYLACVLVSPALRRDFLAAWIPVIRSKASPAELPVLAGRLLRLQHLVAARDAGDHPEETHGRC